MSYKALRGPITAAMAEAEPEHLRLFGLSYDARQRQHAARRAGGGINRSTYAPWKKPRIERVKQ